jgi:hypothetical protein
MTQPRGRVRASAAGALAARLTGFAPSPALRVKRGNSGRPPTSGRRLRAGATRIRLGRQGIGVGTVADKATESSRSARETLVGAGLGGRTCVMRNRANREDPCHWRRSRRRCRLRPLNSRPR